MCDARAVQGQCKGNARAVQGQCSSVGGSSGSLYGDTNWHTHSKILAYFVLLHPVNAKRQLVLILPYYRTFIPGIDAHG